MSWLSVWLSNHYSALKDFAGPVAAVTASITAAGVTIYFGRTQAAIAKAQAKIAADKIKLDLFDRRLQLFEELMSILAEVLRSGSVRQQDKIDFYRATDRASLLFGPEVTAHLRKLNEVLFQHMSAETAAKHARGEEAEHKAIDKQYAAFNQIEQLFRDFRPLVDPYLEMHHKGLEFPA